MQLPLLATHWYWWLYLYTSRNTLVLIHGMKIVMTVSLRSGRINVFIEFEF
jgi:hypothetical protein